MRPLLDWLSAYRPSTHTLVGILSVLQAAYLADSDMQQMADRLMVAHPAAHVVAGYCLLVLALYHNGASGAQKNEKEQK